MRRNKEEEGRRDRLHVVVGSLEGGARGVRAIAGLDLLTKQQWVLEHPLNLIVSRYSVK